MKCLISIAIFTHLIATVFSETPDNKVSAKYDAAALLRKIFNTNDTILPRANYGLIQFEGQISQPDFVNFETQNNLEDNRENSYAHDSIVKFENEYENNEPTYDNFQNVKFEQTTKDGYKKKKRRKRKPKQNFGQPIPGNVPNLLYAPGYYYGNGPRPYPAYGGQNRPPRPRPSLASEALSAVTGALTSIALYDDYQCVPRLLCEAAAGGALGSSGILQSVSGLQPLLTLLSAYSGLTSNPLFVFGRAVLLGAASKTNPATCRYAYNACPNDPEQLIYYLNNYNGGFFRFFNSPQPGQQNVQQFYDQLSQNYQPNQEYNQQNYGFNNQPNYGFHNPNLYSNYNQNYGLAYPYQNNGQNIRFKSYNNFNENANKIENRVLNKPNTLYINDLDDENPKWTFPEGNRNPVNYVNNDVFNSYSSDDTSFNYNDKRINHNDQNDGNRYHNDYRKGKILKFPGANNEEDYLEDNYDKKRGSFFPEHHDDPQYFDHNTPTDNNYDNSYYDHGQYLDYNTPTKTNNYDSNYHDNRQYSDYNIPTKNNNNYNDNYYHYNRQYSDYNTPTNNNNYNGNYHNNKQNSDYNYSNNNYQNKYVNRDEYYANQYYANKNKYNNNDYANENKYYNYNNVNNYGNKNKYNYNNDLEEGIRTVYVVRGNGDPSRPEIHKLRPGQTIH